MPTILRMSLSNTLSYVDLGCFSDVDIRIDTASGGGPADYEVTFQVTELGRARGTINTMVGNQEGSLLTGLAAPNLLGMRVCKPCFIEEGFRHLLKASRTLFNTLELVMLWRFLSYIF